LGRRPVRHRKIVWFAGIEHFDAELDIEFFILNVIVLEQRTDRDCSSPVPMAMLRPLIPPVRVAGCGNPRNMLS